MHKLLIAFLLFPTFVFAGDVSLSWEPSPSAPVIGYIAYYGTSPDNLKEQKAVDVGDALTTDIVSLPVGTWYFAVSAYSADQESALSNIVSTTFDSFTPPNRLHTPIEVILPPGGSLLITTPGQ